MRAYRPFSVCTCEALLYTEKALGIVLGEESRADLMQQYKKLPTFPEEALGLTSLKNGGNLLAAFSNGDRKVVRGAKLLPLFDDIVSTHEVRTFKPDRQSMPVQRLGQVTNTLWLVSSNPFDIIGAKTAGLRVAWAKRDPKTVFYLWRIEPPGGVWPRPARVLDFEMISRPACNAVRRRTKGILR